MLHGPYYGFDVNADRDSAGHRDRSIRAMLQFCGDFRRTLHGNAEIIDQGSGQPNCYDCVEGKLQLDASACATQPWDWMLRCEVVEPLAWNSDRERGDTDIV